MKRIRMAAIILAAAIFPFAFAGCSADSNSEKSSTKGAFLMFCINAMTDDSAGSPAGTWKLTGGEAMGTSVSADQLGDTSNATMVLNEDGTVEGGGNWKLDGNTLVLSQGGMSFNCTYSGNSFTIDMGIMKMIYSRA